MYLKRLEVQGFKTFAKKTVLEFAGSGEGHNPLTVVVGPNGSGKSNLSDAIRWCLGEQSMKQLRGKESQDIIFSGSEGRGRANVAEVALTFDNSDKTLTVEAVEVTITRRFYRDGESDYLLQGQPVRLQDIQLLLAEAGVGQRSYSVVGQGMVDHVLTASPEERKIFFDDATGVRGLQIRRHQAMLKLERSAKNLTDVDTLLKEIEPRLSLLKRQVKRLTDREKIEMQYQEAAKEYFAMQYWTLFDEKGGIDERVKSATAKVTAKKQELKAGDEKLLALERAEVGKNVDDGSMQGVQAAYKKAQADLSQAREAKFAVEREIELAKVRAQSSWAPLPLTDIVAEVKELVSWHERLFAAIKSWTTETADVKSVIADIESVFNRSKKLRDRLIKPAPEDVKADPATLKRQEEAKKQVAVAEKSVKEAEMAMDAKAKAATASKGEVFAFQRELRQLQGEVMTLENERNRHAVDLARVEERIEALKKELVDLVPGLTFVEATRERPSDASPVSELHDKLFRLRHQLETIGGIDPEVVKEHKEVDERFSFLTGQVADLRQAISSTEKIIDELDAEIRKQSEKAFKAINEQFQKYFKVLFGGGSCSLVKLSHEDVDETNRLTLDRAMDEAAHEKNADEESAEALTSRIAERKEAVAGIDIQATPPGKKLKALNLLSGGERALTSIALLSAIMETNPSPFVVLDEVDAALDEANTVRFANILNELRRHTQFIVITHNRATMEKADTLYGVTMGDDGISSLLSVRLEDIGEGGSARR